MNDPPSHTRWSHPLLALLALSIACSTQLAPFRALERRDDSSLQRWLAEGGDPDLRNDEGTPLLNAAALAGYAPAVEILIEAGADLEARDDEFGMTPLVMAAVEGNYEATKSLLANGAEPNARSTSSTGNRDSHLLFRELLAGASVTTRFGQCMKLVGLVLYENDQEAEKGM